jgi:hypothetical protein
VKLLGLGDGLAQVGIAFSELRNPDDANLIFLRCIVDIRTSTSCKTLNSI